MSRWGELYALIVDFTVPGRALRRSDDNTRARSVKPGNPIVLITEAETLGGGTAVHAVVSRIKPDLLTVDLDGCADVVAPHVLEAAAMIGAPLVYLAASGSPNSVHIIVAPPTASARAGLIAEINEIRGRTGLDSRTVDVLTPARYLRLPGSASLKPDGDFCRPIDIGGTPAAAAAIRAESALDAAVTASHLSRPTVAAGLVAASEGAGGTGDPLTARRGRTIQPDPAQEAQIVITERSPRAWRRRRRFSDTDWRLFNSEPPVGTRSDRATEAAWRLWQSGIRDWSMAGSYYRKYSVFAKFAERDEDKPGSARAHWESIVSVARAYRPPHDSADDAVIGRVRDRIAAWTDRPAQAIAVLAIIENRFSDGYGVADRPIAVRDLMSWLNLASLSSAKALLGDLVDDEVLAVSTPYERSAPREATRYTLVGPEAGFSRTDPEHDFTISRGTSLPLTTGEPLSPVWGVLGACCWQLYSYLLSCSDPVPSAVLAAAVGIGVGTRRSGCLHLLNVLVQAQLVTRIGTGRATRWVAVNSATALRDAEKVTGACERLKAVRTRINAERSSWHAESRTECRRAQRMLRRVLEGLRGRAAHRQLELGLVIDTEYTAGKVITLQPTGLRRRARNTRRSPTRRSGRDGP